MEVYWDCAKAFGGNFAYVFLLDIQIQYVIREMEQLAFVVSLSISTAQLVFLSAVVAPDANLLVQSMFALGGACGIVTSIRFNKTVARWLPQIRKETPK